MEAERKLILGLTDFTLSHSSLFLEVNDEEIIKRCSGKGFTRGRLLLALKQYLQHTKVFDSFCLTLDSLTTFVYITNQASGISPNGTFGGMIAKVNRLEVGIDVTCLLCEDIKVETVDSSYPFKINDFTFVPFK